LKFIQKIRKLKFHKLWNSSLVRIEKVWGQIDQQSTKTDSTEFGQILVGIDFVEISFGLT